MFRRSGARTGIDLGTVGVKLVRLEQRRDGGERITHVGSQPWAEADRPVDSAARALEALMERVGLGRHALGRVAVALGGSHVRIREAVMPPMTPKELKQALPFEARRHLEIDDIDSPILDAQILGDAPPAEEGGPGRSRVLFAATSRASRSFSIDVLKKLGIEPEVIDPEPLAALNAALGDPDDPDAAVAVLDVGGACTQLHVAAPSGGFMSREIGDGVSAVEPGREDVFARTVADGVHQSVTFYRGRHRLPVRSLWIAGGGALDTKIVDAVRDRWSGEVSIANPLVDRDVADGIEPETGPLFLTAFGLCRRWGTQRV